MAIKEFFRKLSFEVSKRNNPNEFSLTEFYFPLDDEPQEIEVGESYVSVSAKLQPEL